MYFISVTIVQRATQCCYVYYTGVATAAQGTVSVDQPDIRSAAIMILNSSIILLNNSHN